MVKIGGHLGGNLVGHKMAMLKDVTCCILITLMKLNKGI